LFGRDCASESFNDGGGVERFWTDAVLATLKSKVTEAGPLVLFHPSGGEPMEPKQLVV